MPNELYKIERKKRKTPVINMAPLIDMVFLLLIFFMLTTTLVQQTGIEVKKPKAVSARLLPRDNILVTISQTGEIYLEGEKLPWDEFKKKLKSKIERAPLSTVIIIPDEKVKMAPIVDVMDEATKLGAGKISIATEYEKWEEEK